MPIGTAPIREANALRMPFSLPSGVSPLAYRPTVRSGRIAPSLMGSKLVIPGARRV